MLDFIKHRCRRNFSVSMSNPVPQPIQNNRTRTDYNNKPLIRATIIIALKSLIFIIIRACYLFEHRNTRVLEEGIDGASVKIIQVIEFAWVTSY